MFGAILETYLVTDPHSHFEQNQAKNISAAKARKKKIKVISKIFQRPFVKDGAKLEQFKAQLWQKETTKKSVWILSLPNYKLDALENLTKESKALVVKFDSKVCMVEMASDCTMKWKVPWFCHYQNRITIQWPV